MHPGRTLAMILALGSLCGCGDKWRRLPSTTAGPSSLPVRVISPTTSATTRACPLSGPRQEALVEPVLRAFVANVLGPAHQRVGEAWLLLDTRQQISSGPQGSALPDGVLRLWIDVRTHNGVIATNDDERMNYKEYCVTVHWEGNQPVAVEFDLAAEAQGD